jgi:hypothetical protein
VCTKIGIYAFIVNVHKRDLLTTDWYKHNINENNLWKSKLNKNHFIDDQLEMKNA